jgi:hypothetical protein
MLETIRTYAAERFAAGDDEKAVRERQYGHFLALAQQHGSPQALWGTSRKQHLAELDDDIDNVHAALGWVAGFDAARPMLELCAAVGWYWLMRYRYADAVNWIDRALGKPATDTDLALRVRALCIKSVALFPLGRGAETGAVLDETEALARRLAEPALLAHVLQIRASYEAGSSRSAEAQAAADESERWARVAGDRWAIALAAFATAMASSGAAQLRQRVDRAAALLEEAGNIYYVADILASAAYGALCDGSDREASDFAGRATPFMRKVDSPYLWMLLSGNVGLAALLTGDADAARDAFREELRICRELVVRPFACEGLFGLAAAAVVAGNLDRAARLLGASAAHRYGIPEDPVDRRLKRDYFDPARARHGADAWDAGVRAGTVLSFDDAIAFALAGE